MMHITGKFSSKNKKIDTHVFSKGSILTIHIQLPEQFLKLKQVDFTTKLQGYKTFFMLNSTEHEIYPAHKC